MATITMNNMGEIIFEEYGRIITDPSEITYIKRHSDWKTKVYQLSMNLMKEIDNNIESCRNCYKNVPSLIKTSEIQNAINNLHCNTYTIPSYEKESFQIINNKAVQDANRYAEINALKKPFWNKKKNKKEMAAKKLQEFIDFYKDKDADKEAKYYENENNIKKSKDADYLREFNDKKSSLLKIITDNEKEINTMLLNSLNDLKKDFAVESISGNYNQNLDNTAMVTVILPEKNSIEARKGNMLASGKISVKLRSEKDINSDWTIFCYGVILHIVSKIFNVNTCINKVLINAQYNEISKTTGNITVKDFTNGLYDRLSFEQINFKNIEPEMTVKSYEMSVKVKKQKTAPTPTKKNKKIKNKYEIEYSSELSNMTIDIVITGLKTLANKYDKTFFTFDNETRLLNAIKDILPKNEAEQQLIKIIVENHFISELQLLRADAESNILDVLADNNLSDKDRFLSELKEII